MPPVKIIYKDIKNIILKVTHSHEVMMSVPKHTSDEEIANILAKKEAWIQDKLKRFYNHASPKLLVNGEEIDYLGKRYHLKISKASQESVCLVGKYLHIQVRDIHDYTKKEKLLKTWYHTQAKLLFRELLDIYCIHLGLPHIKTLRIKEMKTRWGSCNPQKAYINLNLRLIQKDRRAIEYVILHELAHLKHAHHNKAFYAFIESHMPDWKERHQLL